MVSLNILGVEFYPITLSGALHTIDWMLSRTDGCTRLVVTANPVMVMIAQRDPEFMEILKKAHLIVPDGVGILWAARKRGLKLPERVTGVDLATSLLKLRPSPRFFFLGGQPGIAESARRNIERDNPGVQICGTHHGYFSGEEEEKVVGIIREARPDVLFVAMGSPRQEKFVWRNRKSLGARVALGLGGVLDVLAGKTKRAPEFFQKAGLEWLYRLVREPRRIKNDILLFEFALRVYAESLGRGKRQKEGDEASAE
ncbi:MAG TPA: WecB/TagA/CpsF family glycosyltransferase [Firmicutes bacterium]|nr:WecB/TagA/CpsF family glycosyltransferase [Candidatus Fermentithermobacillaceae bacterium]